MQSWLIDWFVERFEGREWKYCQRQDGLRGMFCVRGAGRAAAEGGHRPCHEELIETASTGPVPRQPDEIHSVSAVVRR